MSADWDFLIDESTFGMLWSSVSGEWYLPGAVILVISRMALLS